MVGGAAGPADAGPLTAQSALFCHINIQDSCQGALGACKLASRPQPAPLSGKPSSKKPCVSGALVFL